MFFLLGSVAAYIIILVWAILTRKGPDSGFFILGIIFYGVFWSPVLLVPLIGRFILNRYCRSLQKRIDVLHGGRLFRR